MESQKKILAFVGMPGAGKSEGVTYLKTKGIPFVRFGDVTDEGVAEMNLPLTTDTERQFREKIRKVLGMAAYAIRSLPKIEALLKLHDVIAIDGLYSWEEYIYLKNRFAGLTLIHVFAEPIKRYKRLSERSIRPVVIEKAYERDCAELEKLNKGGPIAIADYLIDNTEGDLPSFYQKIDSLMAIIGKNI